MRTSVLLAVPVALALIVSPARARPSSPGDAATDVRMLASSIETIHPAPFRSVSKARFHAEVDELVRRAPSLRRDELLVGVLRILALLGPRNGHTGLFPGDLEHARPFHLFPVRVYDFADGVYVVDAADPTLRGSRLVAIGDVPFERVLAQVDPLVPRDNASNLRGLGPHYALVPEVLDGLGIVEGTGAAELTFERTNGERSTRLLEPITTTEYVRVFNDPLYGHYPSILPAAPRPLYLSGSARPMWATRLEGGRAVYVGYNAVVSPTNAFIGKLQRLVASSKVRRIVVDVRLNGGGDNTTYGSLTTLFESPRVNRRGRLFLLTGRATFSAAANFAAEIDRDSRATVVGEATGGGVETYGDTVPVLLPATGWNVRIASRYHERKRGPRDHRLAVVPDVRVDLTSAQYFAGRDPVLERALRGR